MGQFTTECENVGAKNSPDATHCHTRRPSYRAVGVADEAAIGARGDDVLEEKGHVHRKGTTEKGKL